MIRTVLRGGFVTSLLFFGETNPDDNVSRATETEKHVDLSLLKEETGLDRVKQMFKTDEFGNLSKEVDAILSVAAMSSFVGAVYGGTIFSRGAYVDFIKNNQATAFKDHLDAKKQLQHKVTMAFTKGAWKWGTRLTAFSTSFMAISTVSSVYRGKATVMDYVAAGLLSGVLYKFNMGPRGWLVGGGLGSVLGLIGGCATVGLLQLSGMSMDDVRYWNHHWQHERERSIKKSITDYVSKEEMQIIKQHDALVGSEGNDLKNVK